MQTQDPVFALIEENRAANERLRPYCQAIEAENSLGFDEALGVLSSANLKVVSTPPSTWDGFQALLAYWRESDLKEVGEYATQMVETLAQSFERLKDAKH